MSEYRQHKWVTMTFSEWLTGRERTTERDVCANCLRLKDEPYQEDAPWCPVSPQKATVPERHGSA